MVVKMVVSLVNLKVYKLAALMVVNLVALMAVMKALWLVV